jgi:5-oxoprolinase (ATP-hydrolysing) subunit A
VASIDLNADVGEGFPTDEALLGLITSANVACGFHAGDASTMARVSEVAAELGVVVGAHVGYRDRESFGRRPMDVAAHVVGEETAAQIEALRLAGGAVRYVKPHGALYTRATHDRACAEAIVAATLAAGVGAMLGLPGSALLAAASTSGLLAVAEGFADRGYRPDGSLVPRSEPGAMLGVDDAVRQGVRLALGGSVATLCVHGDEPGAVKLAAELRAALAAAGVDAASFE